MKVICPNCREVFDFSPLKREGMKVECPKCRVLVLAKYKSVELIMFILALILLVFVFFSSVFTNTQLIFIMLGVVVLEYLVRYAYVVMHNLRNKDYY